MALWITDRTQDDIDYVKELNRKAVAGTWTLEEQAEWAKGLRGALSYTDFNRVESGMKEIAVIVGADITVKTDWTENSYFTQSHVQRWLDNCAAIKSLCSGNNETASVNPDMVSKIGYEDMNAMENFLSDVERIAKDHQLYCSEPICGGEMYYAYSL